MRLVARKGTNTSKPGRRPGGGAGGGGREGAKRVVQSAPGWLVPFARRCHAELRSFARFAPTRSGSNLTLSCRRQGGSWPWGEAGKSGGKPGRQPVQRDQRVGIEARPYDRRLRLAHENLRHEA